MNKEDKEKTTLTDSWKAFMYDKIPFGLMNVGTTFQHPMDTTFVAERDKFIVIYLDDMTGFYKTDVEHLYLYLKDRIKEADGTNELFQYVKAGFRNMP